MEQLKTWLTGVIGGMVSHPGDIFIEGKEDEAGLLFTVSVHPEDCGKVIGKGGQHADALRVLLRCAGSILNFKAALKIQIPQK